MKKMLGAMALGVVLAASSVTAAEAAPKSFTVTAKVSKSSSSVGQKVKVSGKVTGQSAKSLKGQKVTVQRKYGNGKWSKAGTAKLTSSRKYSFSTKLTRGGNTSFRVIKSKSGKIKSGTSAPRTLSVFKTFDLTSVPQFNYSIGTRNAPVTMNGKTYPKALQGLGQMIVFVDARNCTEISGYTGFLDRQKADLESTDVQGLQVAQFDSAQAVIDEKEFTTSLNQVAKRTVAIKPNARLVALAAFSESASAVVALPTMRCNSDSLAPVTENDVAL